MSSRAPRRRLPGHDPGADDDGDPAGPVADPSLDLAGVDLRPDVELEPAKLLSERDRALDRPRRALEDGEEAVAGGVDLTGGASTYGVCRLSMRAPSSARERMPSFR